MKTIFPLKGMIKVSLKKCYSMIIALAKIMPLSPFGHHFQCPPYDEQKPQ